MIDQIEMITGVKLSGRIQNCLLAEGVTCINQLMGLSDYRMRTIPNMGARSAAILTDVQSKLRVHATVKEDVCLAHMTRKTLRNCAYGAGRIKLVKIDDHSYNPAKTTWVVTESLRRGLKNYEYYTDLETLIEKHPKLNLGRKLTQRVVVSAACRLLGDVIVLGGRHFDALMHAHIDLLMQARGLTDIQVMHDHEEGFVDQYGTWLTREEALAVATESGQLNRYRPKRGNPNELFSEDLY